MSSPSCRWLRIIAAAAIAAAAAFAQQVPARVQPVKQVVRSINVNTPESATNTTDKTFTSGAQTGRGMTDIAGRYQLVTATRQDLPPSIAIAY